MNHALRVTFVPSVSEGTGDANANVLPGTSDMGAGMDVFGEYLKDNSAKLPIIDVSDRSQTVEGTDLRTCGLITVRPGESGKGPAKHGWFYTTATEVKGWFRQDRHSFYVPDA